MTEPTVKTVSIAGELYFPAYRFGVSLNGRPLEEVLAEELGIPFDGDLTSSAQITISFVKPGD